MLCKLYKQHYVFLNRNNTAKPNSLYKYSDMIKTNIEIKN